MVGFDAVGLHAVGELITATPPAIVYPPVSRSDGGSPLPQRAERPGA